MASANNSNTVQEDDEEGPLVPNCIVEDLRELSEKNETPLRKVAQSFKFPLSEDDYRDLAALGQRFENMEGVMALSLPQLGIMKRAILFEVKRPKPGEAEEAEQPRTDEPTADEIEATSPLQMGQVDLVKEVYEKDPDELWPKSLWINPTYTIPRDAVLDEDYEVCYSLKCDNEMVIGPVFRLNRINYRAYDSQGRIYEGQAEGYVARVIQHEIDHLDGKLYIDYVQPDRVMKLPEYVGKAENGELPELQRGIAPEFTD